MNKGEALNELGPLPVGWAWVRMEQILDSIEAGRSFVAEGTPPERNQVGIMKVSAVTWGHYDETESKTVHDPAQVNPKYFVCPGDLLFSRANTIDLVGAVVLVERVTRDVMLSDKILRLSMPQRFKKWILWALRSQHGRKQITSLATGNQESMRNIGQDRIRQIAIPLPPPAEQHQIVVAIEAHFSRLDATVASLRRAKANVKRARASVLKAAVEGRLVPTEAALARAEGRDYEPASTLLARTLTERRARWAESGAKGKYREPAALEPTGLGALPGGWAWASADQICRAIESGMTPSKEHFANGARVPFIKVYNLTFTGALDFEQNRPTFITPECHAGSMQRSITRPGDVLMNIVGPPLGKVSIVPNRFSEWNINQAIARFSVSNGLFNRLLSVYLQSDASRRWLAATTKTTTSQVNLAITTCRRLPIPLPPLAEQHRIVAEVDRRLSVLDALDANLDANLARCAKLRQSILKRAFEGRLVRPEAPAARKPKRPLVTQELVQ